MQGASLSHPPEQHSVPNKPSIVVLPFTNMGTDAEQEYFADGVSEDLITALSKSRWLFVIARNTSFVYKGKPVDIKQIGRELGVRYVLEGSVRKAGNRVRITAQLIEADSWTHLWGERYDRDIVDAFAVQDEITESVVGAIEPELLQVERQRAARKRPENMDAWDHYLRGMWRFYQFSLDDQTQAERLMRRAIELDPISSLGQMGLARVLTAKILFGWSVNLEADLQGAYAAARRAVELDDKDPYGHYILAWDCLFMRKHEDALAEAQKAIDLAPNFALAFFVLGAIRVFFGRFDEAHDAFQRAVRLSPHEPLIFHFANYPALAQYQQGNYAEAAKVARMGIAIRPNHMLHRTLAACYGQLGLKEEARIALMDMLALLPKDAERQLEITNPYVDPSYHVHFIEGLVKAGWTSQLKNDLQPPSVGNAGDQQ
jgi:adenylate cyclase